MECPYLDKKQKFCHAKRNFISPDGFIEYMCESSIEFGHNPKRFKTCEAYKEIEKKKPKPKIWSVS